jgi:hypothetical protein
MWHIMHTEHQHTASLKVAATLHMCTIEEQQSVIRFLISEVVKPIEVHQLMKVHHQNPRSSRCSHLQGGLCRLSFGTNEMYFWSTTHLEEHYHMCLIFRSLEESSSTCSQIKVTWTFG